MERSFTISKEGEYFKDYQSYKEKEDQQRKFVNQFFNDNNIEANQFYVGGDGKVNQPFNEYSKSTIALSIIPTENDLTNFNKMLKKPNKHDLYGFKKNSKIAKDFAQKCIDEKIVINLCKPMIGDYFKSISYYGCGYQQFTYKDKMYLKIESDFLKEDDTPEGFTEIKLSEYYKVLEEFEEENKNV